MFLPENTAVQKLLTEMIQTDESGIFLKKDQDSESKGNVIIWRKRFENR